MASRNRVLLWKNNTRCSESALHLSFLVLYILADLISFLEIQLLQLAGSSSLVFAVNLILFSTYLTVHIYKVVTRKMAAVKQSFIYPGVFLANILRVCILLDLLQLQGSSKVSSKYRSVSFTRESSPAAIFSFSFFNNGGCFFHWLNVSRVLSLQMAPTSLG